MMKKIVYGTISVIISFIAVLLAGDILAPVLENQPPYLYYGITALIGIIVFIILILLSSRFTKGVEKVTEKIVAGFSAMSAQEIISRITGTICGLIIASLLGIALARIAIIGSYLALVLILIFTYLGWLVGGRLSWEGFSFSLRGRDGKQDKKSRHAIESSWNIPPKILDTSVIIDGRIADIYRSGFMEGDLVIASFILEELRHIADSSDNLKRNRGRGGLDTLNRLREQFGEHIIISETDYPKIPEVDTKLLRLAHDLGGIVVTNDFNLNKVARLQGMQVLNINELANAVKLIVLPGEEMTAQVIKQGKEANQGIAYLDDGTMIVVENGAPYVGINLHVTVTSILQTAAGRMIFARPKLDKNNHIIEAK
jgi:uncharacterized protein YacL